MHQNFKKNGINIVSNNTEFCENRLHSITFCRPYYQGKTQEQIQNYSGIPRDFNFPWKGMNQELLRNSNIDLIPFLGK